MAVVAVDLDGVCYEWHRTYIYMMKKYRGVEFPGDWRKWWVNWNSPDSYTTAADRMWIWTEGVRLGLFRHGHVTRDAIVSLVELADTGNELIVCTHRPASAVRDTINWLDHHFGSLTPYPWSDVRILSGRQPKTTVSADILIDDKDSNVYEWAEAGRQAIVFARPWNVGVAGEGITRATGWADVVAAINGAS